MMSMAKAMAAGLLKTLVNRYHVGWQQAYKRGAVVKSKSKL
jgi:hypothetical protein